jgi:polar amino acid transport system permease protein
VAAEVLSRREVRAAARRRQGRRGAAIAALSTVVVVGGLAAIVVTSPGWDAVRETFFSWEAFKRSFPGVLDGFWLDVKLFMSVEVIVLVLAMLLAVARTTAAPALFPLRLLGAVYVDVMRGIPTVLLVYLIGFGIPALELSGLPTDPVILGAAAVSRSNAPDVSQVYRGSTPCTPRRRPRRWPSG